MSTEAFCEYVVQRKWSESTQVSVLERYIENQQADDAFEDFVYEECDLNECSFQEAWDEVLSDSQKIEVMLDYIHNQDSLEAFKDYLLEVD